MQAATPTDPCLPSLVQIPKLDAPVRNLLAKQKEKLHSGNSDQGGSILSFKFEKFVLMIRVLVYLLEHSVFPKVVFVFVSTTISCNS